ncbi:hypothetical protein B7R54_00980 [Subtercola boreus]|uniref:Uncharacterized protein n=2 Tax=Subtercola boreus TaxID=120213 RepID=A0A3E0VEG2_9MICO|nr:hypothetical protein B7R54_00980 [Subtercola boreus]TQL55194.1 hypothetical protein FB464_2752 [Subtercola boreus]
MQKHEAKWRDYHFGYSMNFINQYTASEFKAQAIYQMKRIEGIASRLPMVISEEAQQEGFGKPGEPGDPVLMDHIANRFASTYSQILDWADDLRAFQVADRTGQAREMLVRTVDQPIQACREFVDDFSSAIEAAIARRSGGDMSDIELSIPVTFTLDSDVIPEFLRLIDLAISEGE